MNWNLSYLSSGNHEKLQLTYGGVFIILINSDW